MTSVAPRRAVAVNAAKAAALAARALGRGGGTAFPGLIAARLDPRVAPDLAAQLDSGSITVSGTNGKTTTSRLLAGILRSAGVEPVRNESGSNLMRGLTASLVLRANALGNLPARRRSMGLFEVDEAALPGVLQALRPNTVLLLNLFRDQLDRYGEVATIARLWSSGLASLPASSHIIVNADDPLLVESASAAAGTSTPFGIESADTVTTSLEHAADVKSCPRCGAPIAYTRIFLGHLGHYSCASCGFTRPEPVVVARGVKLDGVKGASFELAHGAKSAHVDLPLPGMYNVYNALAAGAAATELGVPLDVVARSLSAATPAFGRMERVILEGRQGVLALAKNPAGLNEVLRTALNIAGPLHLLMLLNDNTADGHDVSWIWDADVEMLAGRVGSSVFSGTRGPDMALRFKYASALPLAADSWGVIEDPGAALTEAIRQTPAGETLLIIPTYTALLAVRDVLSRQRLVRPFWEE